MATRNALKDVNPEAITICKQGANRQRIFLRKSVAEADLLTLPHEASRLLKAGDGAGGWSTFYCVVAEPGAEEDPGMTGEADSVDVWLDADEIRKAAHRLAKNKGYVNLVHDGLEEEGLAIVENAIALTDIEIESPDGDVQTIKKDSWYVAIECNEEAIAKVESGEITGVSLEGSGIRVPLEKDGAGSADRVSPEARKKLKGIIAKYRKAPHPFRACMRDNKDRFAKPEAVCGVLKKLAGRTSGKLAKSDDSEWVDALIEAGVDDDNVDEFAEWCDEQRESAKEDGDTTPIAKTATFAEVIAEREMTDSLWRAWSALEGVIFAAFRDEDEQDPKGVVRTSLAEFEAYLLEKLSALPDEAPEGLAKILGTFKSSTDEEEKDMGLTEDIAALKKTVEDNASETSERLQKAEDVSSKLVDLAGKLTERIEALASGATPEGGSEPVKKESVSDLVQAIGKVADRMDEQDSELENIAKSVRALSAGSSSQEEGSDTIRKTASDNPLAGLLA